MEKDDAIMQQLASMNKTLGLIAGYLKTIAEVSGKLTISPSEELTQSDRSRDPKRQPGT